MEIFIDKLSSDNKKKKHISYGSKKCHIYFRFHLLILQQFLSFKV